MKNHVSTFFAIAAILCACSCRGEVSHLTDALEQSAWESSEWISSPDSQYVKGPLQKGHRAADGAVWFVREVNPEKKLVSAKWMTTGLGVYQLYINGQLVGEEILKPGFTHFEKTKIAYTYDVTALMRAKNTFAAQVTPGWWADKIVSPHNAPTMRGQRVAFRAVLELKYSDGSKELVGTDTLSWKAGIAGPVKHAAIFDGEEYDARELPGYQTPEKLVTPIINREFNGEIVPTCGAEIYLRKDLTLKPVEAYVWKDVEGAVEAGTSEDGTAIKAQAGKVVKTRLYSDGQLMRLSEGETLVIDFGQNCAAVPEFVFKAARGVKMTCLPAELLNDGNGAQERGMDGPEGSVHRTNLRTADLGMRVDYTFAGDKGFVTYHPSCTFFGYRFISITADGEVEFKAIRSIPVSSITAELETGKLTTGSELINKLISNTVWGQRSNYLSVPTDCPQRDERLGWTADTQVFAQTGAFFADTDAFFHKWLRDMRDSQSPKGGYPGVAPRAQYGAEENNMMRVGWADAGVIVPWTIWKQFGDASIIEESWESMEKYMDHVAANKYDHAALAQESGNYQWADWLSYEALESWSGSYRGVGPDGKKYILPEALHYWNFLCGSYWAIDAALMRDMAKASGHDAEKYAAMTEQARDYLRENFLNPDGSFQLELLNSMQTPALFALKNHLVEGQAKQAMIERLKQNFADHDNCLQTGFLGTSILMQTLTDNGMGDIAYELLFQRKNPSWLYSVDNGATTIWERWNSYTLEGGMGPKGMNSFNHYAYGCVCQWIWETAAGICADPAEPGFKHIIMKPLPDRRLGSLEASYKSVAGLIKSSWNYEGDVWTWNFTVPEGSVATVTLPGESESKDYEAGSYTLTCRL